MSSLKINGPTLGAQVHYQVFVIEAATGRIVTTKRRKRNLILDQGLDGIAARTWAASFTHAVVGTGTTPTKRDSGAVTVSQTGTTLTASAGFFVADDVGRLFKADTGEERRIVAFGSGTSVEVSGGADFAASEGTVWYVNQTGLTTESKRSGTTSSDAGDNGTSFLGDTVTMWRTFIFGAESGVVTYREIGWSHTATTGGNLFGRDLLAGAGVVLGVGQQLKVRVELSVSASPSSSTAWANVIAGWSQNGAHGIETFAIAGVGTFNYGGLEPSDGSPAFSVSGTSTAIAPMQFLPTQLPATSVTFAKYGAWAGYASGSFQRSASVTFTVSEANSTTIRSIGFGSGMVTGPIGHRRCYRVLLDAAETKDSDHTLSLTFTLSWGRVLTN